jgi:hypothetical protein
LLLGRSVSLDGDTLLVGAINDDGGSAYWFVREGEIWTEQFAVLPGSAWTELGDAVALDGDTALVADSGTPSVFVYTREGAQWSELQELLPTDAVGRNRYGRAVALDGDTALVADPNVGSGTVWVFIRANGVWQQQDRWVSPETDGLTEYYQEFGESVALLGDTALVGMRHSVDGAFTGIAHVFVRDQSSWRLARTLEGEYLPNLQQTIGLSADTALLARFANDGPSPGRVDSFVRDESSFSHQQTIASPDIVVGDDFFGAQLSVDGDWALIAAGVDKDHLEGSGAVYAFEREGDEWVFRQKLVSPYEGEDDHFGYAVADDGETAVVTAPGAAGGDAVAHAYVFTLQE